MSVLSWRTALYTPSPVRGLGFASCSRSGEGFDALQLLSSRVEEDQQREIEIDRQVEQG